MSADERGADLPKGRDRPLDQSHLMTGHAASSVRLGTGPPASSWKYKPPPNSGIFTHTSGSQGFLFRLYPLCPPSPSSEQARPYWQQSWPNHSQCQAPRPRDTIRARGVARGLWGCLRGTQAEICAHLHPSRQDTFVLAQLTRWGE